MSSHGICFLQENQAARWLGLQNEVRLQTKSALLAALAAQELDIGHTSALVVAKVAAIEIPRNQWPELIPQVLKNSQVGSAEGLRQSSIEVLGYICEELAAFKDDYLDESTVNAILTGVVTSMRPEEGNMDLRYVATKALTNALDYAESNFERAQERNYIMEMVCHGTGARDPKVREASWECFVRVAENYYQHLPAYISTIFQLTETAMNDEVEGVAMQALEFWSTVADEEFECLLDAEEGKENKSFFFIGNALGQLVPLLLNQLTKQDELADEGSWNVALAAGAALSLAASVARDPIVPIVMPYVQQNIQRNSAPDDWRFREAATFAFGCILDGPDCQALGDLARSGLNYLLSALSDSNPLVKNTTAWCLGRIFEFVHGYLEPPLITPENLPLVVETLLKSLQDDTFIAEKVCYAISKLADGFSDQSPSPMSQYFETIIGKLLEASMRVSEIGQSNIQIQAFAAINDVVSASSPDAVVIVAKLVPVMNQRIQGIIAVQPTSQESSEQQVETLNLLCGVLSAIITKLYGAGEQGAQFAAEQADNIMTALLAVFACRQNYIPEEAMLAVGALTYVSGKGFVRYMEAFYPFLEKGLKQVKEWQTCLISLGILGDVCRALEEEFAPFCDSVMQILAKSLEDPEVPKSVKPSILASFGDIAIAIGDTFLKYLGIVSPPLQAAAAMSVDMAQSVGDNEDEIEYINSLRQNILDAWSGMFNGISKEFVELYLKQFAPMIVEYVETIAANPLVEDLSVLNRAVGALGDVAAIISGIGPVLRQKPFVKPFLEHCMTKPGLDEKARWALSMVEAAEG